MLTQVNGYRAAHGQPAVVICGNLQTAAAWLTNDEAVHNFVSSTGSDGSTTLDRITASGYLSPPPSSWSAGENTAGSYVTVAQVLAAWEGSAANNSILLDPRWTQAGFAVASTNAGNLHRFWTQDFGFGGTC
jgi:uncharacterized protein YkwD